jgi:RNA-directed DNA polymerase
LIFNAAMPALDEHLHRPWKPGGTMQTSSQRARRRASGLPNWRPSATPMSGLDDAVV